jgi:hypothetical protein
MEHYLSVTIQSGQFSNTMVKAPLGQVLRESTRLAPQRKEDCWLVSNGYNDHGGKYTRAEHNFKWIDTILLDVDNPQGDPSLLDKFKCEHAQYDYLLWETASSSVERPKFRVILLLDKKIPWINEPQKFTKEAILQTFSRWTDDNASWFFTPTKSKLTTIFGNRGKPYPSANITNLVSLNEKLVEAMKPSTASKWDRANSSTRSHSSDGWRNLPSVKRCLEGLRKGERDEAINKACYGMRENGYASEIPRFLGEIVVPNEFKVKFKNKYARA